MLWNCGVAIQVSISVCSVALSFTDATSASVGASPVSTFFTLRTEANVEAGAEKPPPVVPAPPPPDVPP